jgi:hypothetical protein
MAEAFAPEHSDISYRCDSQDRRLEDHEGRIRELEHRDESILRSFTALRWQVIAGAAVAAFAG